MVTLLVRAAVKKDPGLVLLILLIIKIYRYLRAVTGNKHPCLEV